MKIITLCGEKGCCPVVKIGADEVSIGEDGNLCVLKRGEWNSLVEKIKTEEIHCI